MAEFDAALFAAGSIDRIYLTGERDDYLGEPVVSLMLTQGDEALTVLLDGYHLKEFRKAVQRAERWLTSKGTTENV